MKGAEWWIRKGKKLKEVSLERGGGRIEEGGEICLEFVSSWLG